MQNSSKLLVLSYMAPEQEWQQKPRDWVPHSRFFRWSMLISTKFLSGCSESEYEHRSVNINKHRGQSDH
uniref:Uncharacterized protein n=1 Tax=Arundo donax TaxID=35708 RepID=A0A0A9F255_ARUDO